MLDDRPRAVLAGLVREFGRSLASDPLRTEALLRDTCGNYPREIFVIVNAARLKVPADLLAPRQVMPLSLLKSCLAGRLAGELSFSTEASAWAVDTWAAALGLGNSPSPGSPDPAIPSPPPENPGETGPEVAARLSGLAEELESPELGIRLGAVATLADGGDPGSIRLLIAALGNGNWQVRSRAFDALAASGPHAVPALCGVLGTGGDELAWRAVLVLGAGRAGEAVPAILPLLDRDGAVCECAIWALGEIGDPRASAPLSGFIGSGDPVLRQEAEAAILKIDRAGTRST